MKKIIVIIFCVFASFLLYAQNTNTTEADLGDAYFNKGLEYYSKGDYENSLLYYEQALEVYKAQYGETHQSIADLYNNIGSILQSEGNYENAFAYFDKALRIYKDILVYIHPSVAIVYDNLGKLFFDIDNYDMALENFIKSLEIKRELYGENHPDVVTSYNNIANVFYRQGNYYQALDNYQNALKIQIDISNDSEEDSEILIMLSTNIGNVFFTLGKYKESFDIYEQALQNCNLSLPENHPYLVSIYGNLGNALSAQGKYENALEYSQKALELGKTLYGDNTIGLTLAYNNIGINYYMLGRYVQAIENYEKSLDISIKYFGNDHTSVARVCNNIGRIYSDKGDYDTALLYYKRAVSIYEIKLGINHLDTAGVYNNIASVYEKKNDYEKAGDYFLKALRIYLNSGSEKFDKVAMIYSNLALIFFNLGADDDAILYYLKAIEIEKSLGLERSDLADYYGKLASVYSVKKDYDNAIIYAEKAVSILESLFGIEYLSIADSYFTMGLINYAKGDTKTACEYFSKTINSLQNSAEYQKIIDKMRTILSFNIIDENLAHKAIQLGINTTEHARLDMSSIKTDVMKKSLPLYYYGVQFESSRNNAPKAFEYSESLRNRGFLDQFGTETAINLNGITVEEKNEIHALMEQITASRNVIAKLTNAETDVEKERYKKAGETLTEAEKKLSALDEKIGKRIPAYAQLRNPQPVKAEDAQKWCGKKRAILEYVLPSEDSESGLKTGAYCLIVTDNNIKSVPLDSEYDYYTAVAELRSAITEKHQNLLAGNIASIHKYRTTLYEKLIEPVLQYIPSDTEKLLIVPDGSLSSLPFDILGKPDEKLLGDQYALSFSPSVSVSMFKEKHIDKTINMLGIGNPVYSETESSGDNRGAVKQQNTDEEDYNSVSEYYKNNFFTWENLPGAGQELRNLKTVIFPKDKVDIFEQANATEKLIKQLSQSGKLADYNQILISCHGYFNTEKPEMSTLVFSEVSGADKESTEDGYLTVDELALLKMNAQFLNLSACQTGLSAEKQGDGMLGLTRSCIIAGADNVGVTLWSVNDKATCAFQEYLYGFIKEGMAYPAAYQKAKEKMKVSEEWSNPEYWAGFVLYE